MEVYIKAGKDIQQYKVDLMMNHLEKVLNNHPSIDSIKISLKHIIAGSPKHRVRTVIKINGHNILCMVIGKDIYDTTANLVAKVERSIINFYENHNIEIDRVEINQAA